jgi:hypothetical protein
MRSVTPGRDFNPAYSLPNLVIPPGIETSSPHPWKVSRIVIQRKKISIACNLCPARFWAVMANPVGGGAVEAHGAPTQPESTAAHPPAEGDDRAAHPAKGGGGAAHPPGGGEAAHPPGGDGGAPPGGAAAAHPPEGGRGASIRRRRRLWSVAILLLIQKGLNECSHGGGDWTR